MKISTFYKIFFLIIPVATLAMNLDEGVHAFLAQACSNIAGNKLLTELEIQQKNAYIKKDVKTYLKVTYEYHFLQSSQMFKNIKPAVVIEPLKSPQAIQEQNHFFEQVSAQDIDLLWNEAQDIQTAFFCNFQNLLEICIEKMICGYKINVIQEELKKINNEMANEG